MLPPFGDGVPHLVQAEVELLDHVTVAVPNMGGPRQEKVIGWLPHGLKDGDGAQRKRKKEFLIYTEGNSLNTFLFSVLKEILSCFSNFLL